MKRYMFARYRDAGTRLSRTVDRYFAVVDR